MNKVKTALKLEPLFNMLDSVFTGSKTELTTLKKNIARACEDDEMCKSDEVCCKSKWHKMWHGSKTNELSYGDKVKRIVTTCKKCRGYRNTFLKVGPFGE